jgi:hypothetical protein
MAQGISGARRIAAVFASVSFALNHESNNALAFICRQWMHAAVFCGRFCIVTGLSHHPEKDGPNQVDLKQGLRSERTLHSRWRFPPQVSREEGA